VVLAGLALASAGGAGPGVAQPNAAQSERRRTRQATDPVLGRQMQADEDLASSSQGPRADSPRISKRCSPTPCPTIRQDDVITASGHVSLQQTTGEVLFADFMELSDHFQNGFMQKRCGCCSPTARDRRQYRAATDGNRTELRRGVYSPCDLCKDDPTAPPLWQLRAGRSSRRRDAHHRVPRCGVSARRLPIVYTPYISHADPTVKRQSGFLCRRSATRRPRRACDDTLFLGDLARTATSPSA